AAQTLGIDDSAAMLARAAAAAGETLQFAKADIASFAPDETYDLLFSNAALHWVADHEQLLARLRGMLAPGGQLAIQMPANDDHPSHSVAAVLAVKHGATAHPDFLLPVERYATLLHELGFTRQHVRLQVYGHLLPSTADVVEWVRGALLTDYEARLGERFGAFLEDYRTELPRVLGDERPFFYTYKRVLIWAGL
ncbi:MAG TPA: methyltransferase domain-containing protein, partial [Thermoanaerobaculia bacterium]